MHKFLVSVFVTSMLSATAANAVELVNADAEPRMIVVTENGRRVDVEVPAGAKINVCPTGCFLAFPSGEVLPMRGPESVLIQNGKARLVGQ